MICLTAEAGMSDRVGSPIKKIFPRSTAETSAFIMVGLVAVYYLTVKLSLLFNLAYFSDVAAHTQQSFSWLLGRPLFSDNVRGVTAWYHNDFILLPFGPLTLIFGPGVFFVAEIGLLATASLLFIHATRVQTDKVVRWTSASVGLFYCWGPFVFWQFDNPIYGFHSADFYIPLAAMFGAWTALGWKHRWIWLILIAGVHEAGALHAAVLHGLAIVIKNELAQISRHQTARSLFKIVCVWGLVFVAGMLVLKVFGGDSHSSKSLRTLELIQEGSALHRHALKEMLLKFQSMYLLLLIPMVLTLRLNLLPLFLIGSLPAIAVGLASSFAYFPESHAHAIHWGPRFAPMLALAAFLTIANTALNASPLAFYLFGKWRRNSALAIILGLLIAGWQQVHTLSKVRDYQWYERFVLTLTPEVKLNLERFDSQERHLLSCLRKNLPRQTRLRVAGGLATAFTPQDYTWNDNAYWPEPPEIVVCDRTVRVEDYECKQYQDSLDPTRYNVLKIGELHISYTADAKDKLTPCI